MLAESKVRCIFLWLAVWPSGKWYEHPPPSLLPPSLLPPSLCITLSLHGHRLIYSNWPVLVSTSGHTWEGTWSLKACAVSTCFAWCCPPVLRGRCDGRAAAKRRGRGRLTFECALGIPGEECRHSAFIHWNGSRSDHHSCCYLWKKSMTSSLLSCF